MVFTEKIIEHLIATPPVSRKEIANVTRKLAGEEGGVAFPTTTELLKTYHTLVAEQRIVPNIQLAALLQKRPVRTLSGVAIITVLARPYPCPGKCSYCPTEVRMPKSYLEREPAAWRALILKFDPYTQMRSRIETLMGNGHPTDKIELIVKGGTWSAYPPTYQRWFLKRCFDGANDAGKATKPEDYTMLLAKSKEIIAPAEEPATRLEKEHRQIKNTDAWSDAIPVTDAEIEETHCVNESGDHRIIGITLETRPDWITAKEVARLRSLGCTRIELGVQHTDPAILRGVNRGHDITGVKRATRLLREAGFKVDFHMMPQLPGATPTQDIAAFDTLWSDPDLRPDMIKIYPCVVLKTAEIFQWWKEGTYKPYSLEELIEVLITVKSRIPHYVRISRLIRDIPADYIYDGNRVTNLRQTIQELMKKRGLRCHCLRCREIGHRENNVEVSKSSVSKLFIDEYEASEGKEFFLSFEDPHRTTVYAFCRLRIPARIMQKKILTPELDALLPEIADCAFIRELHTYGHLIPIGEEGHVQHTGLGKHLMEKAKEIAENFGIKKIAVIAGVGVRAYYEKLGYTRKGTYMIKE